MLSPSQRHSAVDHHNKIIHDLIHLMHLEQFLSDIRLLSLFGQVIASYMMGRSITDQLQ